MIKPFIINNELSFKNFISFLFLKKKIFLYTILIYGLLYSALFFLGQDKYIGKVSFYTNYLENKSSLLNIPLGMNDSILPFSIKDYLESEKFMQNVIEKEYTIGHQRMTLVDYWGSVATADISDNLFSYGPVITLLVLNKKTVLLKDLNENEIKSFFARKELRKNIKFAFDRNTDLYTISVEIKKHPVLAAELINNIYQSIIDYDTNINNGKALEKSIFIENRLEKIENELYLSEQRLIDFLDENKELKSPSLIVQKNRLERSIDLFNQLFINLSDELEQSKIDQYDNTSSIYLLENPDVISTKKGSSYLRGLVYSELFIIFILTSFLVFRNRKKLIV